MTRPLATLHPPVTVADVHAVCAALGHDPADVDIAVGLFPDDAGPFVTLTIATTDRSPGSPAPRPRPRLADAPAAPEEEDPDYDAGAAPDPEPEAGDLPAVGPQDRTCPDCGKVCKNAKGLTIHRNMHRRAARDAEERRQRAAALASRDQQPSTSTDRSPGSDREQAAGPPPTARSTGTSRPTDRSPGSPADQAVSDALDSPQANSRLEALAEHARATWQDPELRPAPTQARPDGPAPHIVTPHAGARR